MTDILESLASGRQPEAGALEAAFGALMDGGLGEAQAGAFLMGLRARGESAAELSAGVAAALQRARLVEVPGRTIDTCGTGGDGKKSFNCSTAVGLYLAAMDYSVVKHGNRAISSSSGSADILESMGVPLDVDPDKVADEVAKKGFVFLFAPRYHPAFAKIAPVRKALGIRTIFNLMGPLLNPARPKRQILGVPRVDFAPVMAESLAGRVERAAVVHGAGGYDELTPFGISTVVYVENGELKRTTIDPEAFGLGGGDPADVVVNGKDEAQGAMLKVLAGGGNPTMKKMLALNLGLALYLLEDSAKIEDTMQWAASAVNAGAMERLIEKGVLS